MRGRLCIIILIATLSSRAGLGQPLGEVFEAGKTYSTSMQAFGGARMIGANSEGRMQVVWTKRLQSPTAPRHVYWNLWNLETRNFLSPGGMQADASVGAAYGSIDVTRVGGGFPTWHESDHDHDGPFAAAGIDYIAGYGAFTSSLPLWITEEYDSLLTAYPRIAVSEDHTVHLIAESAETMWGEPNPLLYARGHAIIDDQGNGTIIVWDSLNTTPNFVTLDLMTRPVHAIACSPDGGHISVAYLKSPPASEFPDLDVYLVSSVDGGTTWFPPLNITQFIAADESCYEETGDWRCCNRDTVRASWDVSILYDAAGLLHLAFTTVGYYHRWLDALGPFVFETQAQIWHWTEEWGFELVAESWIPDSLARREDRRLPVNNTMVGRPCLTLDEQWGTVYCVYTQFDTAYYSTNGEMNADVFVSRRVPIPDSTYGWSIGRNITNTAPTAPSPVPVGDNRCEKDVSSGLLTWDDTLAVAYLMDYSMGMGPVDPPRPENSIFCQRLATSEIDEFPRMPWRSPHVDLVDCGLPARGAEPNEYAQHIRLHEPRPNPFNATTSLRFELPERTRVTLTVHDVLGRLAAVLLKDESIEAGGHVIGWRPDGLSSGVYFASLRTELGQATRKILYLR